MHGEPDELPEPKEFADAITADHKILNEDDESRNADRVALVIMDRFTRWLQSYAANSKASDEVIRDLQPFFRSPGKATACLHRQFEGVHHSS